MIPFIKLNICTEGSSVFKKSACKLLKENSAAFPGKQLGIVTS